MGAVVARDVDEDVEVLEDVEDVDVEVDVLVEVEVDVLVEVEVLEEVEEVEEVDEVDVGIDVLVEVEAMLVVLVVLVPPPTMPAWATNGNITIAKTAMLNTIPTLPIDISAPLLMLSSTFKILKCCCYVRVSRNMNGR